MENNESNGFSDEEEIEFKYQYTYTRVGAADQQQDDEDDEDDEEEIGYAYYAKAGKLDSSDSEAETQSKFQTIPSDDETDETRNSENNNNAHVSNGTTHIVTEEVIVGQVETLPTISTRPPMQFAYLPNQREPVSIEQLRKEAMQNFDQNYQKEVSTVETKQQKVEFSKEHVQDIKEVMKGIKLNFEPSWAAKFNTKDWSDTVDKIKKSNNNENQ